MDEIRDQFGNHIFLKAVSEGRTIGTVRAYEENGTCYIGRLAVHPDSQNQGIGTALMKAIEAYYKPRASTSLSDREATRTYIFTKSWVTPSIKLKNMVAGI